MERTRWTRLGALLSSVALAAYAQVIITASGHWADGILGVPSFDDKLTEIYGVPQSVAIAIPLFAVAMVLFAWATRGADASPQPSGGERADAVPDSRRRSLALGIGLAATAGWTYLVIRLATGAYEGWYVALFFGVLLASGASVWSLDRGGRGRAWPALGRWELLFMMGAAGLFLGLVLADLTNWRYASLGDDGTFFVYARDIAHRQRDLNLFSQDGPAGNHPLLSSAYQAAVMRVAGEDIFGWKLATLFVTVATFPAYYVLIRTLTSSRVAVLATGVLASSHYLLGYAHTGYDSLFPLCPTVFALTLYVFAERRQSAALYVWAGVFAGLGFYTFYSSRATIVILASLLLLAGRRHWRIGAVLPLAGGFVLAVSPLFAVEGWEVISEMQEESQTSGSSFVETIGGLAANAPRSFLAFSFNPYPKHYVSGSLLDDVSAPLALLGLAYAVSRWRDRGIQLLLVWFAVAIVATGLFHPHPAELASRLHYALPAMAAFVALAADRLIAAIGALTSREGVRRAASVALCAAFLFAVLGLNLYRHYVVSPRETGVPEAALVLREAQRPSCNDGEAETVIFAAAPLPVMPLVFDYYGWDEDRAPLFFRFDDPPGAYRAFMQEHAAVCVLVAAPSSAGARDVVDYVTAFAEQRGSETRTVRDASGYTEVLVLQLDGE